MESYLISGHQAHHALRRGAQGYLAWITASASNIPAASSRKLSEEQQKLYSLLEEFADEFPRKLLDELPPERPVDHGIKIEPGEPCKEPNIGYLKDLPRTTEDSSISQFIQANIKQ